MDDDALVTWKSDGFPGPLRAIIARIVPDHEPEITIEQGWWPLLARLDARLASIRTDYRICHVGAEDGRLQFDVDSPRDDEDFRAAIQRAQDESTRTCEVCGRSGAPRLREHAVYAVLCADHTGFDKQMSTVAESIGELAAEARRLLEDFDDVPWPQMDGLFYTHAYEELRLVLEHLIIALEQHN